MLNNKDEDEKNEKISLLGVVSMCREYLNKGEDQILRIINLIKQKEGIVKGVGNWQFEGLRYLSSYALTYITMKGLTDEFEEFIIKFDGINPENN